MCSSDLDLKNKKVDQIINQLKGRLSPSVQNTQNLQINKNAVNYTETSINLFHICGIKLIFVSVYLSSAPYCFL